MKTQIVPTSNEEVDRQLGGGLPVPSMVLVEGDHGSGKSALAAQFMAGLLAEGKNVMYITTESGVKEYIVKMSAITFDFKRPFLTGQLSIVPLNISGIHWSRSLSRHLLPVIGNYIDMSVNVSAGNNNSSSSNNNLKNAVDVIVIDSLSALCVHVGINQIMDFFTLCKTLVSHNNVTVIITVHPEALEHDAALHARSICDCYFSLKSVAIAGRSVRVAEIVKLIGSRSQPSTQFSFEVDQVFGIKIVPISMANA